MDGNITTSFVQQYRNNVDLVLQQKGSKLRDTVTIQDGIVGKAVTVVDQIGETKARKVKSRGSDSPNTGVPHARRWVSPVDYDWGELIDSKDKLRMMNDPKSGYVTSGGYALGRSMDDEIVEGIYGDNKTGENGETLTSFVKANKIVHGDSGFSVAKLRKARAKLRANKVDLETEKLYCVITSAQEEELLSDEKYISGDYGKAVLDDGRLKSFMGFNFIVKEDLPIADNIRECPVYCKSGVVLGIWQDKKTEIGPRADKCYADYVYLQHTVGATRTEEGKVVSIQCKEAA